MNAETGVTLSEADLEAGEAYYTQHGWSGCAGSAWSTLTPGTKDGWRHAESQFSRAEKAEAALAEAEQKGAREAVGLLNDLVTAKRLQLDAEEWQLVWDRVFKFLDRAAQIGSEVQEIVWECGPHANAWNGHDARCRQVQP